MFMEVVMVYTYEMFDAILTQHEDLIVTIW